MKLGGILALSVAALLLTGCATNEPPSVSQKVQDYYDQMVTSQSANPASKPTTKPVVAAFLGDSFTAGVGASQGGGYADLLVRNMNWQAKMFAQGGTGYTNPGQPAEKETAFPERVPAVVAAAPNVVIVQGGINDGSPQATAEAAEETFTALRAGLPQAKIIAVGPVVAPKFPASKVEPIRDVIAAAAAKHGVTFVDPIAEGWLANEQLFFDGVHPTQEGHAIIATKIREALAKNGINPA